MMDSWQAFDRLTLQGTPFVTVDDDCYFYMIQVDGPPSCCKANQLVYNIKINPRRMTGAQRTAGHKEKAIELFAHDVVTFLGRENPGDWALIPIPPSYPKGCVDYDDRMVRVCNLVSKETSIPTFDCFRVKQYRGSMHTNGQARDPEQLKDNLVFDSRMIPARVNRVFLVDDMLTKGTHFRAMKDMIVQELPSMMVVGLFWAKRDDSYLP